MTQQEQIKKQLQEQLDKVNRRLEILDMIEEKLLQMKKLAERVVDEELAQEENQNIVTK